MFIRDNLEIMRGIDDECIDLIYLDPPFNSKHNYAAPIGSEAAGAEFKDTWSLSDVDAQWIASIAKDHPRLHQILSAVPDDSDKSYLAYMAIIVDTRNKGTVFQKYVILLKLWHIHQIYAHACFNS